MQNLDKIGTALLFIAFLIEFLQTLIIERKKNVITDTFTNIKIGLPMFIVAFFQKGLAYAVFTWVYNYAIFKPEITWYLWIIGFLCCDFIYYLYHRLCHQTKFFWASHITHHSSEHYNFSIGLRINFVHLFYRFLFWAPLCLVGIPTEMILLIESLTAIYTFLIHTEKVGKLGILDWIFSTPSNHRVHHASNPEYIDKNMGGVLMIYDHLFGTYEKEINSPKYGVNQTIKTNKPETILFEEYRKLIKKTSQINGMILKLKYLLSSPQEENK